MIKDKSVVGIHYVLKNPKGEELDKSEPGQPLTYLHGTQQIVVGLEKALTGLAVGDKKEVTVSPEEGYGDLDSKLRVKTPRSFFPKDVDLKIGMDFTADLGDGNQQSYTVKGFDGDDVQLDGNHPLAGETLHFSVEVASIREASKEELQHGHAHGEGGHHH